MQGDLLWDYFNCASISLGRKQCLALASNSKDFLKRNVCSVSLKPFLQNRLSKSGSLQIENILIAIMAGVHLALIPDNS